MKCFKPSDVPGKLFFITDSHCKVHAPQITCYHKIQCFCSFSSPKIFLNIKILVLRFFCWYKTNIRFVWVVKTLQKQFYTRDNIYLGPITSLATSVQLLFQLDLAKRLDIFNVVNNVHTTPKTLLSALNIILETWWTIVSYQVSSENVCSTPTLTLYAICPEIACYHKMHVFNVFRL